MPTTERSLITVSAGDIEKVELIYTLRGQDHPYGFQLGDLNDPDKDVASLREWLFNLLRAVVDERETDTRAPFTCDPAPAEGRSHDPR